MAERVVCGAGSLFSSYNWTNTIEPHRRMDVSNSNLPDNCDRYIWCKYRSNLLLFTITLFIVAVQMIIHCLHQFMFSCFHIGVQQTLQFYSVFTILYRVFTFNDCPEAAEEIQKQIKEAKDDLTAKGLKF